MSLGGGFSSSLNSAVANAVAAGIVFTISAGNSNADACTFSPASEPSAITVGATTSADARASYSNVGTCLDLFAPGSGITGAYIPSGSAVLSGTSMAAPHVAGVAGLYLQQNPAATPAQVVAALTTNASANKVTSAGTGSPNKLLYMGFLNGAPPPNQPPVAAFATTCTALVCAFDGTGSTDDVGVTIYAWTFGDGVSGTGSKPSHGYSAAGTYTVTLTVTDAGNLSNSLTKSVTVAAGSTNLAPVANPVVTCSPGLTCTMDGRGSTDDHGITAYEWRSNGGSLVSTQAFLTRQFTNPGTRTWTLTVRDAGGLANSKAVTFTLVP